MSQEPENIVIVYLRRLDAKIDRAIEMLGEHGHRLTRIEMQLGGIRREQGADAETIAHRQAQMDRLRDELDRIKGRLDLVERRRREVPTLPLRSRGGACITAASLTDPSGEARAGFRYFGDRTMGMPNRS